MPEKCDNAAAEGDGTMLKVCHHVSASMSVLHRPSGDGHGSKEQVCWLPLSEVEQHGSQCPDCFSREHMLLQMLR